MAIDNIVRDRILAQLGPDYASAYPKTVEREYPHVLRKIAEAAGPLETERLFEDLMLTQRSGRQGFSQDAFGELLTLISVYRKRKLLREPPKTEGDVWSWVGEIGYESGVRHSE